MKTQRITNVYRFPSNLVPRFLRRRVEVLDGDLELRVTYELYNILLHLEPQSRERALKHVREIFHEQAAALEAYQIED